MKIDMNKSYRTRDGREVRVLMVDAGGIRPVIAAYKGVDDGLWWPSYYTESGRINPLGESDMDLIEVKPRIKLERWCLVYTSPFDEGYATLCASSEADARAFLRVIQNPVSLTRIEIDVEEGFGLP